MGTVSKFATGYIQSYAYSMKKVYCTLYFIAFFCFAGFSTARAQQADYKYHTVFMYNFTKYIKWPDAAVGDNFVIGVLGSSGITELLEKMAESKNVNGKNIVIKTFKTAEEVNACQMLFIPESKSEQLAVLRSRLKEEPTLIVSEKAGLARQGSVINFIINDGRWNFEFNQASADLHKLKVSSELTKFAHKIYTEI